MNDFIKGDTSLIKDLTDEVNRLQTKVAELTNNLNIANLELTNKEQQRLDALNDNKYYKNLCLELTCSQKQIAIAKLEKVKELININGYGDNKGNVSWSSIEEIIYQQIKELKGE